MQHRLYNSIFDITIKDRINVNVVTVRLNYVANNLEVPLRHQKQ